MTAGGRRELGYQTLVEGLRDRNRELEGFAAAVAHDLRGPIAAMSALAREIAAEAANGIPKGSDPKVDSYLSHFSESCRKLLQMIDRLLELARAGLLTGEKEFVPLTNAAREVVADLRGFLGRCEARVVIPDSLPVVWSDPVRLRQVLMNLIINAVKFVPPDRPPRIEVSARAGEEVVTCSVRDNGIGADAGQLLWMFYPFARGTSGAEGAGLGLAITKKIVEAHGGRIWAESEGRDRGCTIHFTLPAAP